MIWQGRSYSSIECIHRVAEGKPELGKTIPEKFRVKEQAGISALGSGSQYYEMCWHADKL